MVTQIFEFSRRYREDERIIYRTVFSIRTFLIASNIVMAGIDSQQDVVVSKVATLSQERNVEAEVRISDPTAMLPVEV